MTQHRKTILLFALFIIHSATASIDYVEGHIPKSIEYDLAPKCEKCLACMGIALKLHDIFANIRLFSPEGTALPSLINVCKHNFQKYSIEELNDLHYYGNNPSRQNYLPVILKEKCRKIAQNHSLSAIYQEWKHRNQNLAHFLCGDKNEFGNCAESVDLMKITKSKVKRPWWDKVLDMLRLISKPTCNQSSLTNIWNIVRKWESC